MATIRKRGEGWQVQVRKKGQPLITKTFSKKVLAERWAKEIELSIEQQTFKSDDPDIGQLANRYLKEVLPLKPSGRTKKLTIEFLSRRMKNVKLSEITPGWLLDYAAERNVSPATLSQDIIFLGCILDAADVLWGLKVDLDAFRRGRMALAKHGMTGKAVERDRRVSDTEIEVILAHVRSRLPMRDLIEFSVASTMRLSEQMGLRWDDLNTDKKTVLIRDRKHPLSKIGNNQEVPLLGRAWEIVSKKTKLGTYIFPYNHKSVATAFQRAVRVGKLDDIRWHDLRHEGISRLFESGKFQIPEVALISGHRDWKMLSRYTQIAASSLHGR